MTIKTISKFTDTAAQLWAIIPDETKMLRDKNFSLKGVKLLDDIPCCLRLIYVGEKIHILR